MEVQIFTLHYEFHIVRDYVYIHICIFVDQALILNGKLVFFLIIVLIYEESI
jgi:hypothetical protein